MTLKHEPCLDVCFHDVSNYAAASTKWRNRSGTDEFNYNSENANDGNTCVVVFFYQWGKQFDEEEHSTKKDSAPSFHTGIQHGVECNASRLFSGKTIVKTSETRGIIKTRDEHV